MLNLRLNYGMTVVAVALLLGGCQMNAPAGDNSQPAKTVRLSGAEEVPPVPSSGAGTGTIMVAADGTMSGKVTISGVNATAAHIHQGAKGANGPVVIPLTKASDSTFVVPDNTRLTKEQMHHYRMGHLYINVHSSRYPAGEIRAQLVP